MKPFGAAALSLAMASTVLAAGSPKDLANSSESAPAVFVTVRAPVPGVTAVPAPRKTSDTSRTGAREPLTPPQTPRELGQAAVLAKGWGEAEWTCLDALWTHESGWNPRAKNPTSSAYGIAQFLDGAWSGTGISKTSDPARQIAAGLIYIERRYGTPCAAWASWQKRSWY